MPTNVGHAGPEAEVIKRAIALEFDCVAAYGEAAKQADVSSHAKTFQQFATQCENRIQLWQGRLEQMSTRPGEPHAVTEPLNRGKVKVGGLLGDTAVALVVKNNAADTCKAYEDVAARVELSAETRDLSKKMLAEAREQLAYIEKLSR